MNSLRGRIAGWYALLLVAVIVVAGILVTVRFQSILYDQARGRIDRTMQDIARVANPSSNPFMNIGESLPIEQTLANSDNLERWSSPTTYLQIDNAHGYPVGKSSNMGGMSFSPAGNLTKTHDTAYRTVGLPRGEFLVEDRLFVEGAGRQFVIHVGEPLDQLNETFARTREWIALIIGLASIAVIVLSIVLAARVTRPLGELALAMGEIGSDRLDRRLKWKGHDEIGKLAATFDDMLARLEEAFARERQFISDASHELRTPLTSINANAQMLRRWGDKNERVRNESLETIAKEAATLASMVNGMLTLAKADSEEHLPKQPVALAAAAKDAVASAQTRAGEKGLTLELHAGDHGTTVRGDAHLIRQMISNLIDNAIKFTEAGRIDVYVKRDTATASVEVCDTGSGIDPDEIPYIFDRFYRTDKSRNRSVPGTGLGLAIVRSIARVHQANVQAERLSAGGTCLRVTFPLMA